jgi:hypothetical protein
MWQGCVRLPISGFPVSGIFTAGIPFFDFRFFLNRRNSVFRLSIFFNRRNSGFRFPILFGFFRNFRPEILIFFDDFGRSIFYIWLISGIFILFIEENFSILDKNLPLFLRKCQAGGLFWADWWRQNRKVQILRMAKRAW